MRLLQEIQPELEVGENEAWDSAMSLEFFCVFKTPDPTEEVVICENHISHVI